jgi:hypothetical protein
MQHEISLVNLAKNVQKREDQTLVHSIIHYNDL